MRVLSSTQLAFLALVAMATLSFVVAGAILGRVAIGSVDLDEVSGGSRGRLPQVVIVGPVMALGAIGIYWLLIVSPAAATLAIVAVLVALRLLDMRRPNNNEHLLRRSRLNTVLTRHPTAVWGLRVLLAAYVAALVIAGVVTNPWT